MNAESGGNAHAVNQNTGGSYDVGLWQINDFNWVSCINNFRVRGKFHPHLPSPVLLSLVGTERLQQWECALRAAGQPELRH